MPPKPSADSNYEEWKRKEDKKRFREEDKHYRDRMRAEGKSEHSSVRRHKQLQYQKGMHEERSDIRGDVYKDVAKKLKAQEARMATLLASKKKPEPAAPLIKYGNAAKTAERLKKIEAERKKGPQMHEGQVVKRVKASSLRGMKDDVAAYHAKRGQKSKYVRVFDDSLNADTRKHKRVLKEGAVDANVAAHDKEMEDLTSESKVLGVMIHGGSSSGRLAPRRGVRAEPARDHFGRFQASGQGEAGGHDELDSKHGSPDEDDIDVMPDIPDCRKANTMRNRLAKKIENRTFKAEKFAAEAKAFSEEARPYATKVADCKDYHGDPPWKAPRKPKPPAGAPKEARKRKSKLSKGELPDDVPLSEIRRKLRKT